MSESVRVVASEMRRLRGVRSTWVVVAAAVVLNAAVAAVSAQRLPAGELAVPDAVRSAAAVVPLLPLPLTALAAAVLGALSYSSEMRWPGLPAARVALRRRWGSLVAKLVVVGAAAVLLAVVTLGLNLLAVRLALPAGVSASAVFDLPQLSQLTHPGRLLDQSGGLLGTGGIGRPLLAFLVLSVVGGWAGLLLTSLVRSAVAGILLTGALPALLEPTAGLVLHRSGLNWPVWVRELLPFQYGLNWVRSTTDRTAAALDGTVMVALLVPAAVLVLAAVLAQLRRRAL
ncbi:hypothetical protein [Streptomyces sp. TLI_171]|uniref:hypothetical protein n=1 Tax=Streptomyces sp. TLI_171 TaxID=1938859 RepID=UPI000C52FA89|nr:hypothetical protein [Streptomyces sp. TLI_171]